MPIYDQFDDITNFFYWKITSPLRKSINCLKKHLHRASDLCFRKEELFSKDELKKQRKDVFPKEIKFSVIVPLYNTSDKYLREMIESVRAQTYANWELCLADGSDTEHSNVGKISRKYAEKDSRIRYQKLEKNLGISGNTNECLKMSCGDYIALLDHDDLIHPAALHEVMKAICDGGADFIYTDETIFENTLKDAHFFHFKPDYAPDTLKANNYICHLTVFSKEIYKKIGGFHNEYDGSQDHDFFMRATGISHCIAHIPEILYYWRAHPGSAAVSVAEKPYAAIAGKKAVADYITGKIKFDEITSTEVSPTIYRIKYRLEKHPKVSILISNYEHKDVLERCISSILNKSTYDNYEIVIVENRSTSQEIFEYYKHLQSEYDNLKVVTWIGSFNFSAINNYGAEYCTGDIILLLNNDIEVITPEWMEEMLMYAQRPDIGAVGAKLYYPDGKIQHAGVVIGVGDIAGHYYYKAESSEPGYMGRLCYAQNLTAVTGACLMLRREIWDEIGGLTENLPVDYNDVDLCMKIRRAGYLNVWTPFAELYHYESLSRGYTDTEEKQILFSKEVAYFKQTWQKELKNGDPYYNPNFDQSKDDFTIKRKPGHYNARYFHVLKSEKKDSFRYLHA